MITVSFWVADMDSGLTIVVGIESNASVLFVSVEKSLMWIVRLSFRRCCRHGHRCGISSDARWCWCVLWVSSDRSSDL